MEWLKPGLFLFSSFLALGVAITINATAAASTKQNEEQRLVVTKSSLSGLARRIRNEAESAPLAPGGKIPKIIWTYWHQSSVHGRPAKWIDLALHTWRRANPSYKVFVVTRDLLPLLVPVDTLSSALNTINFTPFRQSDAARLALLSTYGGVWMDITMLVNFDLDTCFRDGKTLYVCNFVKMKQIGRPRVSDKYFEGCFIAAAKSNPIIVKWNQIFQNLLSEPDLSKTDVIRKIPQPPGYGKDYYLAVYQCLHYILDFLGYRSDFEQQARVFDASENGMYYELLVRHQWDLLKISRSVALDWMASRPNGWMLKGIKSVRQKFDPEQIPPQSAFGAIVEFLSRQGGLQTSHEWKVKLNFHSSNF